MNWYFPKSDFRSVAAADVDGDGDQDLILTNGNGANVLRNTTADRFVPPPGDANRDGQFDRRDVILVLQMGKYLTGQPATFAEGDWNGDGWFDRLDIVTALQTGDDCAGP